VNQPAAPRITATELALRLGVGRDRIDQLADLGVIASDANGRFDAGDVHRVRLVNGFEDAGVPLEALVAASRAGRISLAYYDELHPPPEELSGRTFEDFAASLGEGREHLSRLFTALGLAEPEPDARLSTPDEAFISELLQIVVATDNPTSPSA
jgi:hypothetical protein